MVALPPLGVIEQYEFLKRAVLTVFSKWITLFNYLFVGLFILFFLLFYSFIYLFLLQALFGLKWHEMQGTDRFS